MKEDLEKVKALARDLRDDKESPRRPRETLPDMHWPHARWTSAAPRSSAGRVNTFPTARWISDG